MLHPRALERLLCSVPVDVWRDLWPPDATRRLRQVSKAMQATVDDLRLPTALRMSRDWWLSHAGPPSAAKWAVVLQDLLLAAMHSNVTVLEL